MERFPAGGVYHSRLYRVYCVYRVYRVYRVFVFI
jgi:hypothetical protein